MNDVWPTEPLRGDGVVLRPFTADDVEMAKNLSTDPYVPLTGTLPSHANDSEALAWIERQRKGVMLERQGIALAIAHEQTDEALGHISLWLSEMSEGRARLGYSVAPRARGRGVAARAVRVLTDYAWTITTLHRLEIYVEPSNSASVCTAVSAGYELEGVLRSHQTIGGIRRDMALYASLRPTDATSG